MNREIKFRAWLKLPKQMIEIERFDFFDRSLADDTMLDSEKGYDFDSVELMQFTGLKDMNGKEIYEGDIVKINHPKDKTGDFTNKLGRVFYWEEEAGFFHGHCSVKNGSGRPPKKMFEYCEVVGNIYENPELLKGD